MKIKNIQTKILSTAVVTAALLMIPFFGNILTNHVNWDIFDFVVMGILIFSTGMAYVLISSFGKNIVYKLATAMALGSTLFMVWANLAVGLIGAGPHFGNLMYIGVVFLVLAGIILSRLSSAGMERTMYLTAFSFVFIAVVAILMNMDEYSGSSVNEILGVNALFVGLFTLSGLLYRVSNETTSQPNKIIKE